VSNNLTLLVFGGKPFIRWKSEAQNLLLYTPHLRVWPGERKREREKEKEKERGKSSKYGSF